MLRQLHLGVPVAHDPMLLTNTRASPARRWSLEAFLAFAATVARASSSVSCFGAARRADAKAWIAGAFAQGIRWCPALFPRASFTRMHLAIAATIRAESPSRRSSTASTLGIVEKCREIEDGADDGLALLAARAAGA